MVDTRFDYKINGIEPIFLQAPGGTGKTYVLTTIINMLRASGKIVLAVASSGLAALLLPDGRTAHSRFKIPIDVDDQSFCFIKGREDATLELLKRTALIVWDEAPMNERAVFECVHRSLCQVLCNENFFGGIPVIFSGDWQQMLPVVVRGARWQIVEHTLRQSPLWDYMTTMTLTVNMRIQRRMANESAESLQQAIEFQDFLTKIGHGRTAIIEERGDEIIRIPPEYVSKSESLDEFLAEVYPDLDAHLRAGDCEYFAERGIVTTKNKLVDQINKDIRAECKIKPVLSADEVEDEGDEDRYPAEILHNYRPSGCPPHKLYLERHQPIMLLRTLDQSMGICNGTRLIIKQVLPKVLVCEMMCGKRQGERVYIPRTLTTSKKNQYAFQLRRWQFPVRPAYAMTINKSQGQSFKKIGIYLPEWVFTHGQLYVALSRAGASADVLMYIDKMRDDSHCVTEDGIFTKNIVFKEVLVD